MPSAQSQNRSSRPPPPVAVDELRPSAPQQDLGTASPTTVESQARRAAVSQVTAAGAKIRANAYPSWSPRFWHGMRMGTWWRLLAKNRFRVAPSRLPIALGVSLFSPANDVLALIQTALHGRRIRETRLNAPPIFILGHWRSGTTLLHEMLVNDPQFASPSTYQCFAPWHFVVSEWLMVRFGSFLLPKKRPMDNMEAGWELPQEDEFALMNLGVPTPYLRIAFPQSQPSALEYLDLQALSPQQPLAMVQESTMVPQSLDLPPLRKTTGTEKPSPYWADGGTGQALPRGEIHTFNPRPTQTLRIDDSPMEVIGGGPGASAIALR